MTDQTLDSFLLTRHWRDGDAGLELEYWLSSAEGPVRVRVTGERSVFFLPVECLLTAQELLPADVQIKPLEMRDFHMRPVAGLYFNRYRDARRCADRLREHGFDPLEADINPADRYLMERFIAGGVQLRGVQKSRRGFLEFHNPALRTAQVRPALKVASIDIETAIDELQLYSIGVHASDAAGQTRIVFMQGAGAQQDYVVSCDNQRQVLQAFLDWLQDYDPDVLIGWNVVNFDCWYLQRVADACGMRLLLGRNRSAAHWRELDDDGERRTIGVPGRVVLDGIELLRAAFYRFESFSLQHVASELLGQSKLLTGGGRGEEIGRLFVEDKTALAAYNLKDCELVSEIFATTGMLEFAVARTAMTGLNLDRLGGSVASFDNLYLPRLHRSGYVAPNASTDHIASPGGFVLDSQPGIYYHVLVLDFKSLYPSIIRSFCIDPLGLALGSGGELDELATVEGFLDARFARRGHILPALISQLWQRRDAAKKAGDSALSQAIKIIMNSFYGVLGTPGCRFFDARLASSITRRGHQILNRTKERIETEGHQVIYGDTDSVFVWIREATNAEQAAAAGRDLERDLNAWWAQVLREEFALDSVLELEFETHFQRFLMPTIRGSDKGSKKRYAGLVHTADGEALVFKGLENVRTDWTRLARDFQEHLYGLVFRQQPFEQYVKDTAGQLRAGQCDAQLVYRKRLRRRLDEYQRNVPPHVQAARRYVDYGLESPRRGDWVEYVMTTLGPEPAAAARGELDYDHYLERQLMPVADGILGFVGRSFSELVDQQIQLF